MPAANVYMRVTWSAMQWAACRFRVGALRLGLMLLMIGPCCGGLSSLAQTSDSKIIDERDHSWASTTDLKSDNLLSTRIPVRVTESYKQNGNRTFEERTVQIRGADGHLTPYQEIETEVVQLDGNTVRTTMRTFGRDVNGSKSLIQVTEEEKHTLPGGDSNILRITLNPDVNGKLQPVQQENVETKTISEDVEETNTTVMLPNINGGLAPAFKTHELRKRGANGTTESQKTTLLADGAGKWELSETRHVTTTQEGANRTVEDRVYRRDAEGKLSEFSRVVAKESDNESGEKSETTETYSVDVPGATREGSPGLVERVTTAQHTNTNGEQVTEKRVEQLNPGNPSSGLRISVLVNDRVVPGPSGDKSTVTIRARDSNGSFGIVTVDTTTSDHIPTVQVQQAPSDQPK